MRKNKTSLLFIMLCLFISGCKQGQIFGPKPTSTPLPTSTPMPTATPDAITDEEFSVLAQDACQVFNDELESINETSTELLERARSTAQAYLVAAEALEDIEIIEEYAPQAAKLRNNLFATADAGVLFANDLASALNKVEVSQGRLNLNIDAFGRILIINWGANESVWLDISPMVVLNWYDGVEAINEAAEALGLTGCLNK